MTDVASSPLKPKFDLGSIVATRGALETMARGGECYLCYIDRHLRGDWGDLSADDRVRNDDAVAHEADPERRGRVLSSYTSPSGERISIVTEGDRSVTTIMLPSDY